MFVVNCDRSGRRVLLGLESILAVHNTGVGPIAVYICACDEMGLWHRARSWAVPAGIDPIEDRGAVEEVIREAVPAFATDASS